ncbi:hypothetical protein F442_16428 [Phytophthora nicotianae P10297]|uniref:Uncharacterized protein n=1 Tax=Phytophthora nicotianae P10297 TaxID=1317064 RepID=W2YKL1_PHYNI|nr:hypothetical protein F442_16428 [Phytophthora nicotianae P10297]
MDADDEELAELLPSLRVKRRMKNVLGELKDVESVSKALQGGHVNLLVRVWFDSLIAKKELYSTYLAPRVKIVTALSSSPAVSGC